MVDEMSQKVDSRDMLAYNSSSSSNGNKLSFNNNMFKTSNAGIWMLQVVGDQGESAVAVQLPKTGNTFGHRPAVSN